MDALIEGLARSFGLAGIIIAACFVAITWLAFHLVSAHERSTERAHRQFDVLRESFQAEREEWRGTLEAHTAVSRESSRVLERIHEAQKEMLAFLQHLNGRGRH